MKKREWLFYLFYLLIILVFMILGGLLINYIKKLSMVSYNIIPFYLAQSMFFVLFGFILGIPKLRVEFKKPGKWSVDKSRLFILGIPSLILSFPVLFYFIPGPIYLFVFPSELAQAIQILFGFTIISSFQKKKKNNSDFYLY